MKKIISFLLVVCCLTMLFNLPVSAAASNDVDFVVNKNGENITVTVNTNVACGSLQGAIKFDSAEISFDEITVAEAIKAKNKLGDTVKATQDAVKVAIVGDVNNGTQGEWAALSFTGDVAKFDLNNIKAYSANGKAMAINAYVVFRGDVNDDGLIDIRDLVRLQQVKNDTYAPADNKMKNCDVDADSTFANNGDFAALRGILINK